MPEKSFGTPRSLSPIDTPKFRESEPALRSWSSLENGRCRPHAEYHEMSPFGSIDIRTDSGGPHSKYQHNEDSFSVSSGEDYVLISTLDGAGGNKNGELASIIATQTAITETARRAYRTTSDTLYSFMNTIDRQVSDRAQGGFATGVFIEIKREQENRTVELGSAGDGRIFTIRNGQKLSAGTTSFQNRAQLDVSRHACLPQEYYNHPRISEIHGGFGLGPYRSMSFEIQTYEAESGDCIIFGSDGLWDNVSDYEILQLAKQYTGRQLENELFKLSYERNNSTHPFLIRHNETITVEKKLPWGGDNITLGVVCIAGH